MAQKGVTDPGLAAPARKRRALPQQRLSGLCCVAAPLWCASVAIGGCGPPDLHGPLEGRVEAQANLEGGVRAGVFAAQPFGAPEASSARPAPPDAGPTPTDWAVDPALDGRPTFTWPEEPSAEPVEISPLRMASGPLDDLTLELPAGDEPMHILALAWFDVDDDGKLDVAGVGPSETARTFGRTEGGEWHYLTELTWVPELSFLTGRAESARGSVVGVDAEHQGEWRARINTPTELPPGQPPEAEPSSQ